VAQQAEHEKPRPGERVVLWLLLALGTGILVTALTTLPLENLSASGAFPVCIALVMMGSALLVLRKNRARYAALRLREECAASIPFVFPRTVAVFIGILVLYILLLEPLHFWASAFLFLVGSTVFLKGAGWIRATVVAVGMLAAIYVLFQSFFRVILW
jgi:hypothetical protein